MRGIFLIRHGNTTMDDKVDALLDPPLDEEGVERVKRTIKFMDDLGHDYDRIISSPKQRTLLLAEMLSRGNSRVTTHNGALPWNLGDLMGKSSEQVHPVIEHLKAYPSLRAPHGESYRDFYRRWDEFLHRVMTYAEGRDNPVVLVTHSRNIDALQEIIGGKPIGQFTPQTPEASVTLLANNGVSSWDYTLIWDGK